jgi:hypothetical protein
MRGALEKMGATIYKTYRNYEIETQSGLVVQANEGESV